MVTEDYTGPHDVEKQKRLEQLKKIKPLGEHHPRLTASKETERLSLREFSAKYDGINDKQTDVVSVFGTEFTSTVRTYSDKLRQNTIGARA